jgi:hypothetical protein
MWALQNDSFTIPALSEYARENELTLTELQTLATFYMEDATNEEIEILSDLVMVIAEGRQYGEINEAEEIRYSNLRDEPDRRNWYQKPEARSDYAKPQPIKLKKKTPKIFSKILELELEIKDLSRDVRDLRRRGQEGENEREEFLAWIQEQYDWNILDLLASGISEEDKVKQMENWNIQQDKKEKSIENPQKLVDEYRSYYPEDEDQKLEEEIEQIENEIRKKGRELSDLEDQYGY